MTLNLQFLVLSVVKIIVILAWIYFLLWSLGRKPLWAKAVGIAVSFAIIQLALTDLGGLQIMNDFDRGLLFEACTMTMVALGLNLIYGFNGQFSLGQWGFYGIGAYAAADVTYRWVNRDASGLFVAGLLVLLIAVVIWAVGRLIKLYKGMPVLSQFTLYLIGTIVAGAIAVLAGNPVARALAGGFGTAEAPGFLLSAPLQQAVFLLAVLIGGAFAAEISFLFGLDRKSVV
jgi:branched-chain amino acid transport system permease protein